MTNDKNNVIWPGWEVVRKLGAGTFGTVYEIQRKVYGDIEKAALKVIIIPRSEDEVDYLRCTGFDDEGISKSLHQQVGDIAKEYKIMMKMRDNPNIVHCDDFKDIPHEDGFGWDIYIKMELLTPLIKSLDKVATEEQIIRMAKDICNALIACEEKNITHRDIKPQNILIADNGNFKLGDFGIARTIDQATYATSGIGTFDYMAPEVKNSNHYDNRVDIYSLGIVVYWLLNEFRTPFMPLPPEVPKPNDSEQARSRRFGGEKIPMPKNGSKALKEIVLKACAFNPAERYQTAQEMLDALSSLEGSSDANCIQYPDAEDEGSDYNIESFATAVNAYYSAGALEDDDDAPTVVPPFTNIEHISDGENSDEEQKNKILVWGIIIAIPCILVLAVILLWKPIGALLSPHEHEYSSIYTFDDSNHWQICECGEKGEASVSGHTYGSWKITTEPTNVSEGEQARTCTVCGYIQKESIAAHMHNYSIQNDKDSHWNICDCGHTDSKSEHSYGDWQVTKEPTCVQTGTESRICTVCTHTDERSVDATGVHAFGAWVVVKEMTDFTDGIKERVCLTCNEYKETESISKTHSHSYTDVWVTNFSSHWHACSCGTKSDLSSHQYGAWIVNKAATCTESGVEQRICSVCSYKEEKSISPTGVHTYGAWVVIKAATSTAEGLQERTCKYCSNKETERIPKNHTHSYSGVWVTDSSSHWHACTCGKKSDLSAHKFGSWTVRKAATCTTEGMQYRACTTCSYKEEKSISPTGAHTYGSWVVIKPATCLAEGTQKRICSVCSYEQTKAVAKKAHTERTRPAVDATCTQSGLTAGKYCSVCGLTLVTQNTVPAKGHKYVAGYCTYCGELKSSQGLSFKSNGDGTYGVSGIGSCTDNNLVIPSTYNGKPVTRVNDGAFASCTKLTSVVIPKGVTYIGNKAFSGCTALTGVTLPNSVKSLGDNAFYNCRSLKSITIPASVTSIGKGAFSGANSLSTATFKNTEGWFVNQIKDASNGMSVNVNNAQIAAYLLIQTYGSHYWHRQ